MCGVFGIRAPERDVARVTFFGLFALQHRGQESAGIAVSDLGRLTVLRDMGLVAQVFNEQKLSGLQGEVVIPGLIVEGFKTRVAAYMERSQSRREAPWTRSARTARVSI